MYVPAPINDVVHDLCPAEPHEPSHDPKNCGMCTVRGNNMFCREIIVSGIILYLHDLKYNGNIIVYSLNCGTTVENCNKKGGIVTFKSVLFIYTDTIFILTFLLGWYVFCRFVYKYINQNMQVFKTCNIFIKVILFNVYNMINNLCFTFHLFV